MQPFRLRLWLRLPGQLNHLVTLELLATDQDQALRDAQYLMRHPILEWEFESLQEAQ